MIFKIYTIIPCKVSIKLQTQMLTAGQIIENGPLGNISEESFDYFMS